MPNKVEIIEKQDAFNESIFRVERVKLRHERFDGTMSPEMTRLSLERGDSVAAVVHDPEHDTVLLTEQFRYPTYEKGPGWLIELPAGIVDGDEDPSDSMRRELAEEVGYTVEHLHYITTFYLSPGGLSERIHLYYARVKRGDQTGEGGGLEHEDENIKTHVMPVKKVLGAVARGQLADAKTLIGMQWLQLNRSNLPGSQGQ